MTEKGLPGAVEALLEKGADPNVRNRKRWTALIHAAKYNQVESGRVLIASGAKIDSRTKIMQRLLFDLCGKGT